MASNISIVLGREFAERVKKKSFIITTVLMPVLMLALMCLPAVIMYFDNDDARTIAIVDETPDKIFARGLKSNDAVKFVVTDQPLDSARTDDDVNSIAFFPADIVDNRNAVLMIFNNGSSSMATESQFTSMVNDIITEQRMARYDIGDLRAIIDDTKSDVIVRTFSNSSDDSDKTEASSTGLSYILGMGLSLLLYMALLIYGQMVMTSIIEEKNNRVLEIVVSSVKPFHLMLGKILGVGLVAVTQLVIWGVLIAVGATVLLPAVMPAEAMEQIAAAQAGASAVAQSGAMESEMVQAMAALLNPAYILNLFFWLIIFLVGGFLLYASIFAAIGSAVDSIQDASQFTSFAVVPIILGIVFGQAAAMNPESTLAVWTSFIPLTSPMVMMSRLPFGVPVGQTIVSAIVLFLSVLLFVWLAGKIYRVGIFMYGKKPSVRELIRWARYK